MSNWRPLPLVIAALLGPLSCERAAPSNGAASSAPSSATSPEPTPRVSSHPSATAPPSASSPPSDPAVASWLVGQWKGHTSTYAEVVDDHQTYTRTEVDMSIDATGAVTVALVRGNTPGGRLVAPSYRCKATGRLKPVAEQYVMQLETSTCRLAKAGSEARAQLQRVGKCLVQWNTREGRMPWDDHQIAFRRVGCRN